VRVYDKANIRGSAEDAELYTRCIVGSGHLGAFSTFRNPVEFSPLEITLYNGRTLRGQYGDQLLEAEDLWVLLEENIQYSEGLDDVTILAVYKRPFTLAEGAKPPMSAVMDIVYDRFGL